MNADRTRSHSALSLRAWRIPLAAALFAVLIVAHGSLAQAPPGFSGDITLEQFRAQVEAHANEAARAVPKTRDKTPPPEMRSTDELFLELLLEQAKDAALHQSVDRLAGWRKSIESRFQTQSVPELDVDTIRFAEAKRIAESARAEAEQKRIVDQANALMGRPAGSPLVALLPPAPAGSDDPPDALEKQEKELLGQGEELIVKQYKTYQYGGIALSALLWQEQQLYETELEYRAGVSRDAVLLATGNMTH
jgi:hypothetical protein